MINSKKQIRITQSRYKRNTQNRNRNTRKNHTLRNKKIKKLTKSKNSSTIRTTNTNSKKTRLYVGGAPNMDELHRNYTSTDINLEEIFSKFELDEPHSGYRYFLNIGMGSFQVSNALVMFSTDCAYENIDQLVDLYTFPEIPSLDDDEDDEDEALEWMKIMQFNRKNPVEFNEANLNRYAFATDTKDKEEFIGILKKQLNNIEPGYSPYMCAERKVYKIHLQPKLEYLEHYLTQLIDLYQQNQLLQDGILALKVINVYNNENIITKKLPVIVIYPKDENSAMDILDILKKNITYISESSNGIIPRHNYGINNTKHILYIANGDGDTKNIINEYGEELLTNGTTIKQNVFEDTPGFPCAFIKGSPVFKMIQEAELKEI